MEIKKYLSFSFLIVCLFTASCSSQDVTTSDNPDEKVAWEKSHLTLMGLNGKVSQIKESLYIDDELADVTLMKFDEKGNIINYIPNYSPNYSVNSRWGGDMGMYNEMAYEYDSCNRLVKLDVKERGEIVKSYTLSYGNHGKYVPLPFNLLSFDLFFVKDLESVVCEGDDTFSYSFDGEKVVMHQSTAMMSTVQTINFDGDYPNSAELVETQGDYEVNNIITSYYFMNGCIAKIDQYDTMNFTHDIKVFDMDNLMKLSYREYTTQLTSYRWDYSYINGRADIIRYSIKGEEEEDVRETNSYVVDNNNNWILRQRNSNSTIDYMVPIDGDMRYQRSIEYYK